MTIPRALIVVAFTLVAGCGTQDDGRPASPQVTVQAPNDLFVSTVRRSGELDAVSDSTILAAGREVCAALDRGVSPAEVFLLATETDDTGGGAVIMGSAPAILCREHLPAVEQFVDRLNQ
jgi:hypothetical protein